jgi:hypothetical protein
MSGTDQDVPWMWGKLAFWCLHRHWAREVGPYSEAQGYDRAEVVRTAHQRLDKIINVAWPAKPKPQEHGMSGNR